MTSGELAVWAAEFVAARRREIEMSPRSRRGTTALATAEALRQALFAVEDLRAYTLTPDCQQKFAEAEKMRREVIGHDPHCGRPWCGVRGEGLRKPCGNTKGHLIIGDVLGEYA